MPYNFAAKVFTQRNFIADFLQAKCDFRRKSAVTLQCSTCNRLCLCLCELNCYVVSALCSCFGLYDAIYKLLVDPYLQSLLTKALALFFDSLAAFFANGFSDVT